MAHIEIKLPKSIIKKIEQMQEYDRKAAKLNWQIREWLEKKGCDLYGLDSHECDARDIDWCDGKEKLDFGAFVGESYCLSYYGYSAEDVRSYLEAWKNLDEEHPIVEED